MKKRTLTGLIGAGAIALGLVTGGLASAAPAPAANGQNPWVQTRLIDSAEVVEPRTPLTDGEYQLIPMTDLQQPEGTLVLYSAATGEALSSVTVGFQPLAVIQTGPSAYLVSLNNGSVVQVERDGETLSVGKTVSLGEGYGSGFVDVGNGRAVMIIDGEHTSVVKLFDTTTFKVLQTHTIDASQRPGAAQAVVGETMWMSVGDFHGGQEELVALDLHTLDEVDRVAVGHAAVQGMAADSKGNVWVTDSRNDELLVLDASSGTISDSIDMPQGDEFEYPLGVATDARTGTVAVSLAHDYVGNSGVVVVDQASHKVLTVTPITGEYPSAIDFDTTGNIWACNLKHAPGQKPGGSISIVSSTALNTP